jgi:hypothetical protein
VQIVCDSPAGIERGATLAMRYADAAVIVTNPEVSSVRDSDRIIGLLDSKTEKAEKGERIEKHILITRYDLHRAARGEMLTIDDVQACDDPDWDGSYDQPQQRAQTGSMPRETGWALLLPSTGRVNRRGASDEFFDLTG